MSKPGYRLYSEYLRYPPEEMLERVREFRQDLERRRSVRQFDPAPPPPGLIAECLLAAGTAPSGANRQPWHFEVVREPELKRRIRLAAEEEERKFYEERAPQEWLDALAPLGTDDRKPFLETAPLLIAIFARRSNQPPEGAKLKNYYVTESVGIATGLLIAALHRSGLATLTHTPAPMSFLRRILGRPENERPFLLLVAGFPAADAELPDIGRKPLQEIVGLDGGPLPQGEEQEL
jgi:iodotyrosine deiodinase